MSFTTIDDVNRHHAERIAKTATYDRVKDSWLCNKCGSEIQQTTGYASVHDGPFPLSGSGEVVHFPYPFCPKCDGDPDTPRAFIKEGRRGGFW